MNIFFARHYYFQARYFRKVFKNWKGWETQAILSVTMVQFLIILNLIISIYLLIAPNLKRKFNLYEVVIFTAVFFALDFRNAKLYKNRFDEFDQLWRNENVIKNVIIAFLTLVFAFSLVFINALIFNRYK